MLQVEPRGNGLLQRFLRRRPRVFVSYRRSDSGHAAARLVGKLRRLLGRRRVFFDISAIPPGDDFRARIAEEIRRVDVLLLVVGPTWRDVRTAEGEARLAQEDDPVRLEIEQARRVGRRIVPLLVDGAEPSALEDLPEQIAGLAELNCVSLDHATFGRDVATLVSGLQGPPAFGRLALVAALLAATFVLAARWNGMRPAPAPGVEIVAAGTVNSFDGPVEGARIHIARGGVELGAGRSGPSGAFRIPVTVSSAREGVEVSVFVGEEECLEPSDYVVGDEIDVLLLDCAALAESP